MLTGGGAIDRPTIVFRLATPIPFASWCRCDTPQLDVSSSIYAPLAQSPSLVAAAAATKAPVVEREWMPTGV